MLGLTLIGRDYRILWANKLLKQISGRDLENKLCYSIYNKSNQICQDCGVKKSLKTEPQLTATITTSNLMAETAGLSLS